MMFSFVLLPFIFGFSSPSLAQQELKIQTSAVYKSDVDELMTIKSISVLPILDNVGGIYSRPVEDELKSRLEKNHRFKLNDSQYAGAVVSLDELESNPQLVRDISQNIPGDALIVGHIAKGATGVTLQISLFLKADGKLIAREVLKEKSTFDIKQTKAAAADMLGKVLKQIPYDATVLSRSNSLVTINLGKKNGLLPGQTISAILLIKLNRHPKLNFLISSDKEVLGKIRLDKIDETISFGQILTEKDVGAIQKGTKISGIDFVQYSDASLSSVASNEAKPEQNITFGENPKEWRPSDPPGFGKIGVALGLGQMRYNSQLQTAGALNADSNLYPSVRLLGELWITPTLIANFEIEQGIISADNPLAGSSPGKLSMNISNYVFSFGYNFMIQDDFFGPSVLLSLGFANYGLDVDSSSPLGLTATNYKGFFLGLRGTLPVTDDRKWNMGGQLQYFLKSDLSESPQNSGSSDNTITKFSLLGFYQQNSRLRFTGSLDFSLFSSQFSGSGNKTDPATDSSQKYTTLTGGVEYLF